MPAWPWAMSGSDCADPVMQRPVGKQRRRTGRERRGDEDDHRHDGGQQADQRRAAANSGHARGAEREALGAPALAGDGGIRPAARDDPVAEPQEQGRDGDQQDGDDVAARGLADLDHAEQARRHGLHAHRQAEQGRRGEIRYGTGKGERGASDDGRQGDGQDDAHEDAPALCAGHLRGFDQIGIDRGERGGDDGEGERIIVGDRARSASAPCPRRASRESKGPGLRESRSARRPGRCGTASPRRARWQSWGS